MVGAAAAWLCEGCRHPAPPDVTRPRRPRVFDIDHAALERNFKSLQRAVHPDLFGKKTARERTYSQDISSKLNVAYNVLRNPATRAQYLLQLHGLDPIGETAGHSGTVSPELLMEVMEAREALSDPDADEADVRRMRSEVMGGVQRLISDIGSGFREVPAAPAVPPPALMTTAPTPALSRVCDLVVRLQYQTKLLQEVEEWLFRRSQSDALAAEERARAIGSTPAPSTSDGSLR